VLLTDRLTEIVTYGAAVAAEQSIDVMVSYNVLPFLKYMPKIDFTLFSKIQEFFSSNLKFKQDSKS
jgi:hypothetical protein